jgi:hypothetical protein
MQPIVDPVCQSNAQSICGAILVEYHLFPATRTPQVTALIDGQSQVFYPVWFVVKHTVAPYVRTLVLVAETIRAVVDCALQHLTHVAVVYNFIQCPDLQVAHALW